MRKMNRWTLAVALFLGLACWPVAPVRAQGRTCATSGICTGTVTAGSDAVIRPIDSTIGTAYVSVSGTFTGTLLFKQSGDGGQNYYTATATDGSTTQSTAVGQWSFPIAGVTNFEAIASGGFSGSANVRINASTAAAVGLGGGGGGSPGGTDGELQVKAGTAFHGLAGSNSDSNGNLLLSPLAGSSWSNNCNDIGVGNPMLCMYDPTNDATHDLFLAMTADEQTYFLASGGNGILFRSSNLGIVFSIGSAGLGIQSTTASNSITLDVVDSISSVQFAGGTESQFMRTGVPFETFDDGGNVSLLAHGNGILNLTSAGTISLLDSATTGQNNGILLRETGSGFDSFGIWIDDESGSGINLTSNSEVLLNSDVGINLHGLMSNLDVDISVSGVVTVTTSLNAVAGFMQNSAAPASHYLRGDGTNYVDGTIQAGDLPGSVVLPASLVTTLGTTDNVAIPGMTSAGHCAIVATNALAGTNLAGTFVSNKTTDQVTVTHTLAANMNYDLLCSAN